MKLLDLTLDCPYANIALDEALLETAENGQCTVPVLRLWEPREPIVVLGRSSPAQTEVNLALCEKDNVPVIRRCSGGATVLTANGCLMYAVILSYESFPELRMLDATHQFVMKRIQQSILQLGVSTDFRGTCDLTINNRKVSGNALRCKKQWFVYHGTLICKRMDRSLISRYLGTPRRQPDYRKNRNHNEFLDAIPVETSQLKHTLQNAWQCDSITDDWPRDLTDSLVASKYRLNSWNFKI